MKAQKFAKNQDNKNHASKTIQWLLTCLASSPIFTNKKQAYITDLAENEVMS
jgi:hypothetical protein